MAHDVGRFEGAVHRHLDVVWRVLRRSGLSEPDAEEASQDVFWVLHRRMGEVPIRAERSFLISTALKIASERRRARAVRPEGEPPRDELPASEITVEEQVALFHARRLLDEALDSLSSEQRTVFLLVELEELTAPEVAKALGIAIGTVASRLRTARQAFDAAVRRLHARERGGKP